MFVNAQAFTQDIGGWNVSSGTKFVSGFGLMHSWSCYVLGLLLYLGALSPLLLVSFNGGCFIHVFFIIYVLIVIFDVIVSHHSSDFPISLVRYL